MRLVFTVLQNVCRPFLDVVVREIVIQSVVPVSKTAWNAQLLALNAVVMPV